MRVLKSMQNSWNGTVSKQTKITFDVYPEIVEKFKSGMTLQTIGDEYGVCRERIRQILSLYNLNRVDGGQSTRSFLNCADKSEKIRKKGDEKERKCFQRYGCNLEFLKLMRGDGEYKKSPLMKFRAQRHSAGARGIEWKLTLPEWWEVWQKSGHWGERGLGGGRYVMGRICDLGPYAVGNVAIITHNENSRESREMDFVRGRWQPSELKIMANNSTLKFKTIYNRVHVLGWPIEQALNTPLKKSKWDKQAA